MGAYFVFGLPRSRTAWLSLFLSQSGVYCHHEAVNGCESEADYLAKIDGCGDSTTGFIHCPESVYAKAPVLVIEKSVEEFEYCIEWCNRTFMIDSRVHILSQREKLMSIRGLRVNQEDIDRNLPSIFEHLTGKEWRDQYSNISKFNISSPESNIDYSAMNRFLNGKLSVSH